MPLQLPRLPQTEPTYPQWQVWWEEVANAVETSFDALEDTIAATVAALAAAAAANAAADTAQDTADAITSTNALAESYVTGLTLAAADVGTDATITVSGHTRHYPQPDGSTLDVAVTGGNITGLAFDTLFYIYYDDASRAGGAVTFFATATEATAAQQGDRHTVGAIRTPVDGAADTGGSGTRPPGTRAVDISNL